MTKNRARPTKYRERYSVAYAMQMPLPDENNRNDDTEAMDVYLWAEHILGPIYDVAQYFDDEVEWPDKGVAIDPRDSRMIVVDGGEPMWVDLGSWVLIGGDGHMFVLSDDSFHGIYIVADPSDYGDPE